MSSTFAVTVLVVSAALGSTAAQAEPTMSIGSATINPGGSATVNLNISGLGNGTSLGAFDVNVGFNSSVISFNSTTFGDPMLGDQLDLEGFGTIDGTTPGTSTVEAFDISLDSPTALTTSQPSSFTLASFTFTAVSSGLSSLMLSVNSLADQIGNSISSSIENGSIAVGSGQTLAAPEIDPASAGTALIFLSGCLAVIRDRSRRSRGK
jgi:hypothetical protein